MDTFELSYTQLDAFRELNSIAAGSASTALSEMLNKRVKVVIPEVNLESIKTLNDVLGYGDQLMTVVYFLIRGDAFGNALVVYTPEDAVKISEFLVGEELGDAEEDIKISALKEISNVMVGSYFCSYASLLQKNFIHSMPGYTSDIMSSVLDGMLANASMKNDFAVVSETQLIVEDLQFKMHLIFMPEIESLENILKTLLEI